MADQQEELSAEIAGQKVSVKTLHLNTLATVATLILSALVAFALYTHSQEAKSAAQEFVSAIREQTKAVRDQTTAQREQNCLISFREEDRTRQAEFCKRLSQ